MSLSSPQILAQNYSFSQRDKEGLTVIARKHIGEDFSESSFLFVGFGGTISSGYSPTKETIRPFPDSPAVKSVTYINNFGISDIGSNHIPLLAKDSRDITDDDVYLLFDILSLCPNQKILITIGTYLLPHITLATHLIQRDFGTKKILFTGSILPAGFTGSDAEGNIWSALTLLEFYNRTFPDISKVGAVFHGRITDSTEDIRTLLLHPEKSKDITLEYPDTIIPIR